MEIFIALRLKFVMANNINSIVLLRGLPGSGKSTIAKLLSDDGKFPVFSIDDYFTNENGEYKFDHQKNYLAYDQCRDNCENAMLSKREKIFIDNTFTIDWEMKPYFELAAKYDYRIYVLTVENYHDGKNIHSISDEQIEKMKSKYIIRL